jgi:hypothetical protein
MITIRLQRHVEENDCLPKNQEGFRAYRSGVDAIATDRIISSTAYQQNIPLYKIYIDLIKAYDKVDRDVLWRVLERRGVPSLLINLIKQMSTESVIYMCTFNFSFKRFIFSSVKSHIIITNILNTSFYHICKNKRKQRK